MKRLRRSCQDVLGRLNGGEGGIRTPDTLTSMPDFESGAFNRALPPLRSSTTAFFAARLREHQSLPRRMLRCPSSHATRTHSHHYYSKSTGKRRTGAMPSAVSSAAHETRPLTLCTAAPIGSKTRARVASSRESTAPCQLPRVSKWDSNFKAGSQARFCDGEHLAWFFDGSNLRPCR